MKTKRTRKTQTKKPPNKLYTKAEHTIYLPEGYNGPAYQLENGRTLFVGRWLIMSQWAVLFMPNGTEPERFSSPDLPVVESKQIATSNLIKYAIKKRLTKIQ